MIVAVVPVKRLANAKQRLAGMLPDAQRAELVLCMLADVLTVLESTKGIEKVVVIGSDEAVANVAVEFGAHFMTEAATPGGLNQAIEEAIEVQTGSEDRVLVLPADVPAVTGEDLCRILKAAPGSGIVVVPAIDGGTNALLLSPPKIIAPQFGADSAARHTLMATEVGATVRVIRAESLERDIDTWDDLCWAVDTEAGGASTRGFLRREVSVNAHCKPSMHAEFQAGV